MFEKILSAIRLLFQSSMTKAEVAAKLDQRANGLTWRTSIVDLLKVLELDSSLNARAHLATELGHVGPYTGTAEQNRWLHARVLAKVAEHGIVIP